MDLPNSVAINAWTGKIAPRSPLAADALGWGLDRRVQGPSPNEKLVLGPPLLADLRDWTHPDVGWGLVLPDNPAIPEKERGLARDAPAAIQRLVSKRNDAPIFRYVPTSQSGYIRSYGSDGTKKDLALGGTQPGIGPNRLPQYLLIYGGPESIPWRFQYAANMGRFVGRLALADDALEHYIEALLHDWSAAACDPRAPLNWSVNLGAEDITWLMDAAISRKLCTVFRNDSDLTHAQCLSDADATVEKLAEALAELRPALIVTTSHGLTGPPANAAQLIAQLGALVDVNLRPLSIASALSAVPQGAIWYAHACCSAGSDGDSRYLKLCESNADVHKVLNEVSTVAGSRIAPLPQELLGAAHPIRAFVGHVEPTFDWTLRDPFTLQPLTHSLTEALWRVLYQTDRRTPIGFALSKVFDEAGQFFASYLQSVEDSNKAKAGAVEQALYRQLVAMDRQGIVILGDPTVSLPALKS